MPHSIANRGSIAAGDIQTANAGAELLAHGGNAVDAAVGAAFASFVAESILVNIGGGGMGMVVDGPTGEGKVYDFFSTMPSGNASDAMDFRRVLINFGAATQPFYIGRASVAVPGVVAGLCALAQERGTLPLTTLLAPAITLARDGFILSPQMKFIYNTLFPIFSDTPELAAIYVPGGQRLNAGDRLRLPALADTLEALGREGASLFYSGRVAEAVVADQAAHGGLIASADLAAYSVRRLAPIEVRYRDCTVLLPPLSSVGGALIAFSLRLLDSLPVGEWQHNGVEHIAALAETMRATNAARQLLDAPNGTADGAWSAGNLVKKRVKERGEDHTEQRIQHFLSEANVRRYRERLHAVLAGASPPIDTPQPPTADRTTHISAVDRHGTLATITTSAGENAGFVVGDTGISLNNMLGELDLHPRGFHKLPPGVRLSTMMTPAVVLRNGEPIMATGSGGSNRIRSAIVQAISNIVDFELPPAEAVNLPRVHFEEGELQLEGGIETRVAEALHARGYDVNPWNERNMFFGGAHSVVRRSGQWIAAGDSRRGGATASP